MMFRKKQEPAPQSTYTYEIFPDNVLDGRHEFNGIEVCFSKPGWQWIVYENVPNKWTRVHSVGKGFLTRDAALVDLLEHVRLLRGEVQNVRVV